jgi:hypothetical protein
VVTAWAKLGAPFRAAILSIIAASKAQKEGET